MTEQEWKPWDGGLESPVPAKTLVAVRFRQGQEDAGRAGEYGWEHDYAGYDIVAYRISAFTPEPMTWYDVRHFPPPQKTMLMVTGPSGYSVHSKFLSLAYLDDDFRRSRVVGHLAWLSVANDLLSDDGWVPTHWGNAPTLPEAA